MPWAPELFSAPVLARLEEQRQHKLVDVPLWDGLMTGELDALIGSFAGQPEVHHPVRGRIRGAQEFGAFVTELHAWFGRCHVSVEEVDGVAAQRHGFDEVILRWTVRPDGSVFRSRLFPTSGWTDASRSCGCTTAAGR